MPLASRREEIDRFIAGRAEVCAATDVLGHGVNLPCETLLFAETTKYDGKERRDLEPWEIAQIAGRAGRFGSTSAATSASSPACRGRIPIRSSCAPPWSRTSRSRTATSATASSTAAACARSSPIST
jgi:Superfamily II RNA helicase